MVEHSQNWSAVCDGCEQRFPLIEMDFVAFTGFLLARGWRLDKYGRGAWLAWCPLCSTQAITRQEWEHGWIQPAGAAEVDTAQAGSPSVCD
jgi:hypothetical protein